MDDELAPRLSAQEVEITAMRMRNAELQRLESKTSHAAAQRVHAAESGLHKSQNLLTAHEEEVALLKKRLNTALKRVRELQAVIDEGGNKHWVPPVAPGQAGTQPALRGPGHKTLSAPASPWVGSTGGPGKGGGSARHSATPRGALNMGKGAAASSSRASHDELFDPISPPGATPRPLEREGAEGAAAAKAAPSVNPDEHPSPRAFTPVAFVA